MYDLIPAPTPSLLPLLKINGIRIPSLCLRNPKPSNNRTKNIAGKEDQKTFANPMTAEPKRELKRRAERIAPSFPTAAKNP